MKKLMAILLGIGLAFGTMSMVGCNDDVGDEVEDVADDVGDNVEDATEEID